MTDIEQKQIFAENLNNLLINYHKSQKEVAEAIDVSPQTFNTWCQGIAIPRMGKIQRLADYFHIAKSALIDPPAPAVSSRILSPEESALLDDYQKLNLIGREKARSQIHDLTKIEDYTKDTPLQAKKMA